MQYGFYFDSERCIGCKSCAVACLDQNDIMPGEGMVWRRVMNIESGQAPDTRLFNVSASCNHCGSPACEEVCPTGAISKRIQDGIVVVDDTKCIGCHYCFYACPFGVPQYGSNGTMQKCNLCLPRVTSGQQPSCSAACPGGALNFGTMEDLAALAATKSATRLAGATQPSLVTPGGQ
jgi:anaerobic dimethyl sulfoxide reductase subunit B (iron-sulfur subunit)